MKCTVNGQPVDLDADPQMPLLWLLRDELNLTGTQDACGIGACGACTVQVVGVALRSCVTPVQSVEGRSVRTVEGLGTPGQPHPVQRAWIEHQVPQCGYCQSGVLMAAAALLAATPAPSDAEIDAALSNLCRCGTTPRWRAAIRSAAAQLRGAAAPAKPGR